jgi:hypothetical protein
MVYGVIPSLPTMRSLEFAEYLAQTNQTGISKDFHKIPR